MGYTFFSLLTCSKYLRIDAFPAYQGIPSVADLGFPIDLAFPARLKQES
jgi:hypothetical protein